jgi:hypothetical protein
MKSGSEKGWRDSSFRGHRGGGINNFFKTPQCQDLLCVLCGYILKIIIILQGGFNGRGTDQKD